MTDKQIEQLQDQLLLARKEIHNLRYLKTLRKIQCMKKKYFSGNNCPL